MEYHRSTGEPPVPRVPWGKHLPRVLPVRHASVLAKAPQQLLLLKRMLHNFRFVDLDAQPRPRVRADDAAFFLDGETFAHDVAAPRHIRVNCLADDVARRRESELQTRSGAHRA